MILKMFKPTVFLLLFILCLSVSYAQRDPMRYNRIDDKYIHMTQYDADTTAKALILGDYGVVEILYDQRNGFQSHYTRHMRVKIFDRDALDMANFRIPLYSSGSSRERLVNLKGVTYTPEDGKVTRTRFNRRDSFDEELSDNYKTVNFTLPNVQEGTVFDVEYTVVSPFLYYLPTWYFQSEHPTVFSEFRLYIPQYFSYRPMMAGYLPLNDHSNDSRGRKFRVEWVETTNLGLGATKNTRRSSNVDYTENITILRVDNAPAFKPEPYMNAAINYLSKIEHELVNFRMPYGPSTDYSSTWPKLAKQLMDSDNFGKQLNRSNYLRDEVARINESYSEPVEKMVAAFQLVQQEMTWNRRNSIYTSQNLRRVWDDKQGNSADINLLLVLLLKELDIEAEPVIISTRSHGMINPSQIMLNSFNYVVAWARVDGNEMVMDATEKNIPFYLLPTRCINGDGRLIAETYNRWVNLEAYADNFVHAEYDITVKPCGSIHSNLQRNKQNYTRLMLEQTFRNFDREEDFLDNFESDYPGMELLDFAMLNKDDWSQPLLTTYEFEIPDIDDSPKDILYINPLILDQMESNPFRTEERLFPVDFIFPIKRTYQVRINIPEGYVVDELPRNARVSMPGRGGNYISRYVVNGDNTIDVEVEMELSKALYLPAEYSRLRNFFSRIVEEQARVIVLKRES
ncbi:MAG: DUF3857 domain-containing protein [Bacteroidales bacterium]|nr:DUF3857 domain-containing protein [Bacteroidales bacterium]